MAGKERDEGFRQIHKREHENTGPLLAVKGG